MREIDVAHVRALLDKRIVEMMHALEENDRRYERDLAALDAQPWYLRLFQDRSGFADHEIRHSVRFASLKGALALLRRLEELVEAPGGARVLLSDQTYNLLRDR
jgi:hypothetical protein